MTGDLRERLVRTALMERSFGGRVNAGVKLMVATHTLDETFQEEFQGYSDHLEMICKWLNCTEELVHRTKPKNIRHGLRRALVTFVVSLQQHFKFCTLLSLIL